jgi:hypothetical protein
MRLTYHPDAEAELVEAARFYQGRSPGLGDRFLGEFDAAIAEIQASPGLWPVVEGELRCHTMRRFLFGIYYRAEGMSCASSWSSTTVDTLTTGDIAWVNNRPNPSLRRTLARAGDRVDLTGPGPPSLVVSPGPEVIGHRLPQALERSGRGGGPQSPRRGR